MMFRKLSEWLEEHGILWAWDVKQGVVHLWAMFLTIVFTVAGHFTGWDWTAYWQTLAGIVTFGLPLLAGIIALVKKQKWNPWFWFPAVMGMVIGGIVSIIIAFICGWIH